MPASVKTAVEPRLERINLSGDGVASNIVDYLRNPRERVTIKILDGPVSLRSDMALRLSDGTGETMLKVPGRIGVWNGSAWEPYPALAQAGWYVGSDSSSIGEHTIVIAMLRGGTYMVFSPEGEPDELLMEDARRNRLFVGDGYSML